MPNYVVAIKRGLESDDCLDSISAIEGIRRKGSGNPRRMLVEMTPEMASEVTRRFGDRVNVEPEVLYKIA